MAAYQGGQTLGSRAKMSAKNKVEPLAPEDGGEYRTGSNAPPTNERALERALGSQVRALRRQQDLSGADLAAAAGISLGMMSKIENGQISASLGTLKSLAAALSVPLSSLFAMFEERQDCSFVRASQGVVIDRRGTKAGHVYQLLGHVLRGDVVVEPYLITLAERAAWPRDPAEASDALSLGHHLPAPVSLNLFLSGKLHSWQLTPERGAR